MDPFVCGGLSNVWEISQQGYSKGEGGRVKVEYKSVVEVKMEREETDAREGKTVLKVVPPGTCSKSLD